MIPKVIHYCWFGGRPLPRLARKCIDSWRRVMPDAKIVRWDETNYDVRVVPYTAKAASEGKWAFVSDYARLDIVYRHGGIYLDIDVKLLKSLDDLLCLPAFCGMESDAKVNTGLVLGAEKNCGVIASLRDEYLSLDKFRPCPELQTEWLERHGLRREDVRQNVCGLEIFPMVYFNPVDNYGLPEITDVTYSFHYGLSSWYSPKWRLMRRSRLLLQNCLGSGLMRKLIRLKRLVAPAMPSISGEDSELSNTVDGDEK